jgi:glucose-6-phosphate isomerase
MRRTDTPDILAPMAYLPETTTAAIVERMWRRDPTLFGAPANLEPLIADRFGWLDVASKMEGQIAALTGLRSTFLAEGRTRVVVLGMGGSSLAAAVLGDAFGVRPDGLRLSVLDSTHPAAVDAVARSHPTASSLFVVASKSGTTTEARCFQQHFWRRAIEEVGADCAGDGFIAITDPGSQLGAIAARDGYRRTFVNPPDIGGRYSALSYFGLVPAALAGYDVGAILRGAAEAMASCQASGLNENPGARLGTFLASNAAVGRDKLTIHCPAPFTSLGIWVEQLIAESLGKGGRGIVPIEGEPLGDPSCYGPDRVIVAIDPRYDRSAGALEGAGGLDPRLDAIDVAGTPVLRLAAREATDLGWLFFIWEFATSVAAAHLRVEPFDQPDVERAKVEARRVLAEASVGGALEVPDDPDATSASPMLASAIGALGPSGYVAVQAYLEPTPGADAALARLRARIRSRTVRPVTVGYGPRFLHSTGQLHKGGLAGLCIQLINHSEGPRNPVPGEWYGFDQLIAAQAIGDAEALRSLGRPVLRIRMPSDGDELGIDRLLADN